MAQNVQVATSNAAVIDNATEVASVEQTNEYDVMVQEKNLTVESTNAAPAASNEPINTAEQDCGCTDSIDKLPIYVHAIVDGKEEVIIPAFTDYSMEQPKKKGELLKLADENKRLDVMFHFADPTVFYKEGYTLFDRNGEAIAKGTPNVYVVCDTADSYWRIFLDKVLTNVQLHTFESVQEYAQTIGNTMLLSRGLNNVEKIGYAALATGNEAYKAVYEFSKKNNVPMNTAQLYLDLRLQPTTTTLMTLGKEPKNVLTLGRTAETAQELFEQVSMTFTKGGAKKRYAIRVINSLLKNKKYDYETLMEGLKTIPANEVAIAELQGCADKELCITETLTAWLIDIQRNKMLQQAA